MCLSPVWRIGASAALLGLGQNGMLVVLPVLVTEFRLSLSQGAGRGSCRTAAPGISGVGASGSPSLPSMASPEREHFPADVIIFATGFRPQLPECPSPSLRVCHAIPTAS